MPEGTNQAKMEENKPQAKEEKIEEKKEPKSEVKKEQKKEIAKKELATASGKDLPLSLKHVKFICNFIKNKSPQEALELMEKVATKKIYVPMKGELACRKKGVKGRYPVKAAREFIRILKGLQGNSNVAGLLNPIIAEAVPNQASRPFKKGGLRFKRAHVLLVAREKTGAKVKASILASENKNNKSTSQDARGEKK